MNLDELKNEKEENTAVEETTDTNVQNITEEPSTGNSKVKIVDPGDILPYREKDAPNKEFVNGLMGDLKGAVEYKINEIDEIKKEQAQEIEKEKLAKNDDYVTEAINYNDNYEIGEDGNIKSYNDDDDNDVIDEKEELEKLLSSIDSADKPPIRLPIPDNTPEVTSLDEEMDNVFNDINFDDDEDFNDIFEDDEEKPDPNERSEEDNLNDFKEEIGRCLPDNVLDLSKFTIQKRAISSSKVLNFSRKQAMNKTSDWGLFNSKKPVTLTALPGSEVDKFNPNYLNRNSLQAYKEIYGIIYNHILDESKPDSFEKWTKTILFYDNNHLMFAVYKACFEGTNIIPYSCPNKSCTKNIFMQKVDIEKMVKYPSEEVKEECMKIISKCEVNPDAEYNTSLVQISDNYAIGFKPPTLYDVIFEPLSLDRLTREKYADILGTLSYIDNIYWIDSANARLIPIDTSPVANNLTKSVKRKIKVYSEIINTLNSDEYSRLLIATSDINKNVKDISYVLPETHCPVCGTLVPEETADPLSLVFERHQYRAIKDL